MQKRLWAAVALLQGDALYLLRRSGKHNIGKWEIPGGKVDPGETPIQGACRELLEETGLQLDPNRLKLLSVISFPTLSNSLAKAEWDNYFYAVELKRTEIPRPRERDTHDIGQWNHIDALRSNLVGSNLVCMTECIIPTLYTLVNAPK